MIYALYTALLEHFYGRLSYIFEEIYSGGNFGRKIKNVLMVLNWGFRSLLDT